MSTYATAEELEAYTQGSDVEVPGDPAAVERLLERAERRVDGALGPYVPDSTTGLKLDPADLTTAQAAALSRATCAAAEHELTVGLPFLAGDEDFIGGEVAVLRQPIRTSPRMVEELAGHELSIRSGCALPDPADAADE